MDWPDALSNVSAEERIGVEEVPKISLVMPSYNQARFLETAIWSVVQQDYPRLEFVVRDGGSTDGSVEIIKEYEDQITEWSSKPDGGQAAVINEEWDRASGELLGWLNSDDVLAPGGLHAIGRAAKEHPEAVLFFGDCMIIDEDGNRDHVVRKEGFDRETLLKGKSFAQPSVFMRKSVLDEVGLLDDSLTYALDWSYFLKVLWTYPESRIKHVPSIISCSREYEGTKSRTGLVDEGEERREKIQEYLDEGILPYEERVKRRGLAGTYWKQGTNQFLAGRYADAFRSAIQATKVDAGSLLEKLPRLFWIFRKRFKRL
ncbi:glycosyltransferase family 2 protein [Salinibacter ruber]|uniref:glycosyltransferase family 2 protein n=1 Tax=Salinibacter ruber TaxID=146919 RepID=UPI00207383EA|nr:glycosyltransferase family 2 protein [Salinibacter ruber]